LSPNPARLQAWLPERIMQSGSYYVETRKRR
jgi:hypothetical protein